MDLSYIELNALSVVLSDTIFRLEREEAQAIRAKKKDRVLRIRTDMKDWRLLRDKIRDAREKARVNGSLVNK